MYSMYRLVRMQGFFCCLFDTHRANGLFSIINLYSLFPSSLLFYLSSLPLTFSVTHTRRVKLVMLSFTSLIWRVVNFIDLGGLRKNYQRVGHCIALCRFSQSQVVIPLPHKFCMYGYDNTMLKSIFSQTHIHKNGSIRSKNNSHVPGTMLYSRFAFSFIFLLLFKGIEFVIPIFQK